MKPRSHGTYLPPCSCTPNMAASSALYSLRGPQDSVKYQRVSVSLQIPVLLNTTILNFVGDDLVVVQTGMPGTESHHTEECIGCTWPLPVCLPAQRAAKYCCRAGSLQ